MTEEKERFLMSKRVVGVLCRGCRLVFLVGSIFTELLCCIDSRSYRIIYMMRLLRLLAACKDTETVCKLMTRELHILIA